MSVPEEKIYDLIVVGAGMIGSAAAYHASLIPNTAVCLVGPAEPKLREGQEIFGCWYDEGRVCYQVSATPTWCNLGTKSLHRFRELEKLTGVNFYTESGYIYATSEKKNFENRLELCKKYGPDVEDITKTWKTIFTFLHLPEDANVIWEKATAGHISPRKLVHAHQNAAQMRGAQIVRKIVSTVLPSKCETYKWDVMTECGSVLRGHRVLVAAGGFAALKPLFHHVRPYCVPQLELMSQTISYLHISEEEAQRLKLMPSMVIDAPFGKLDGAYILPPIKYPDGLKVEKVTGDGCVTSNTPTREPYIDTVAEGFGVALGGNGYGAKSCDEIGRLAARLVMLGEWESEIPKERMKAIWEPSPHS